MKFLYSSKAIPLHLVGVCLLVMDTSRAETPSTCVTRDVFGSYRGDDGKESQVYRYTLANGEITVQVIDYGATITAIKVPDYKGKVEDIVLGYDMLEGYLSSDNPYFGATVGRVANRIAGGKFQLDGITYRLSQNDGSNSLHGGLRGFDKKVWSSQMEGDKVVMKYTSPDGEEGFPGQVTAKVTYSLTPDNVLVIEYRATSTKRTPINLTNHAYFNLAGQGAGEEGLNNHKVTIKADHITETNAENIPTGKLIPVTGTPFDLVQSKKLGLAMKSTPNDGFDNNYVLPEHRTGVTVAVVVEPKTSGRWLEVQTTQPGLQFYTTNGVTKPIHGKSIYKRHAAFCLEAQNFPDAINHENFPNSVYGPEDVYHQVTQYKFGASPLDTDCN